MTIQRATAGADRLALQVHKAPQAPPFHPLACPSMDSTAPSSSAAAPGAGTNTGSPTSPPASCQTCPGGVRAGRGEGGGGLQGLRTEKESAKHVLCRC